MVKAASHLLCVVLMLVLASPALAQTIPSQFDLLLDLDQDAGTGCTASTPEGPFAGVETILTTYVDQTTVTSVERQDCDALTGTFGTTQVVDAGGWAIGFGNGEAGFNVIETYLPIDTSSFAGARIGVRASDANSNASALLVVSTGGSLAIILQGLTPVPFANSWWLFLLALIFVALGAAALKRRGATVALTILLMLGAGRAVLVACTLDGQTGDWTGSDRLAGSNAADPTAGVTLRALYGSIGSGRLCFRIDTALVEDATTLVASLSQMALSVNSPGSDPALTGNARVITVTNTGATAAADVQVSTSGFPADTAITSSTCSGSLAPSASCSITITPGSVASADVSATACTTTPGTEPVPSIVTVTATNAVADVDVDVLVLGYGCIYQGGFLFAVDDSTPNTGSIGGKVAALTDEAFSTWAEVLTDTTADSVTDGLANTNALGGSAGAYPAAGACFNKSDQGFTDWYLPAICELGRLMGLGTDPGCGTANANLYWTLHKSNLGAFPNSLYWSSTEGTGLPGTTVWTSSFDSGSLNVTPKHALWPARCIRAFTP